MNPIRIISPNGGCFHEYHQLKRGLPTEKNPRVYYAPFRCSLCGDIRELVTYIINSGYHEPERRQEVNSFVGGALRFSA